MNPFLWIDADLHSGHHLALLPEGLALDDDHGNPYFPRLTATQEYLRELREDCIARALEIIGDQPFAYMVVGDLTHGLKYSTGLMSTRVEDQLVIAHGVMNQVVALPNCVAVRVVNGTAAHTLGEASTERAIARVLRAQYGDKKDIRVLAHTRTAFGNGQVIDVSHHGPGPGIRQWTRGNVARLYLRSLMWQDFKAGNRPPGLVVRAHHHVWTQAAEFDWFRGEPVVSQIIVMASWCAMTEHARQATQSQFEVSNGSAIAELAHDRVNVYPLVKMLDVRTEDHALAQVLEEVAS